MQVRALSRPSWRHSMKPKYVLLAFSSSLIGASVYFSHYAPKLRSTMKAVVLDEFKPWDQLDLAPKSVEMPSVRADEVLVKMKAAAINPIDNKVVAGYMKDAGWDATFPFTPGYDLSGIVTEVGDEVSEFKIGDEVFCVNWAADRGQMRGQHDDNEGSKKGTVGGAFAECIAVPVEKLSMKPPEISHEEAAAASLVGCTAMQCLNLLNVGPGTKLLVLGGAGGVGNMAVQIAKAWGATVYATASSRTREYLEAVGPDGIIDYRTQKWEDMEEIKGIDAVFDAVGEPNAFERSKKVVKKGGSFVSIADFSPALADPVAHAPDFSFASFYCLKNNKGDQDKLMNMIKKKQLKITIEKDFPFTKEGITKLFQAQASGKSMGKNVLKF